MAIRNVLQDLNSDARYYQMGFQAAFLIFGTWVLGWQAEWLRILVIFISCFSVQAIWCYFTKTSYHGLKSAAITALGLCLMLRGNEIWPFVIAAILAISSKYIIRGKTKHIFNPANFGIVLCILLTGQVWISPGQWGSDSMFPIGILVAGLIVLLKVKRAETGFIFLGTLFLLEFGRRYLFLGWPMDLVLHRMSSGSLLVYALFMITDPMTTPNNRGARMIWAAVLAILTFILSWKFQLYEAPIWALFILSPLTWLFDRARKADKFHWLKKDMPVLKPIPIHEPKNKN